MGEKPKRVFVEMAREKQENKRTESRKKTLSDLYKKCKKEEPEWIEALCTSLEKHEEHQLRSDKLYLYYTQKGRCMYSGEPIDLEDLWDNTKYDIDHIYPQSKTMDDSLKNRVLVKKEYNAKKSDTYPIAADIQKKMMPFWKSLLTGGFVPKEKYDRLIRNNPLDANELAGFIERQIVETRQSTKAVAEILKKILPDTEIVYVKAKTVSKFRQDFDFIKVRDMNDLHHAKDAYLNIVVGNVYFVKFTKNAGWFVKENPGRTYNLEKMFIWDVARDGEIAWKAGKSGSIVQVRAMMEKNHILVTRRSYEVKGGLFDQQILKKGKGQVPVKESDERLRDIGKYGGYNKAAGAYFMLVSSKDKKGKEQRTIEFVPIYLKDRVEKDMESARNYLMEERGLREPKILIKKIKIDTLFKVDGFYMWLSGRTSNQLIFKGANQLILSKEDMKTLKKVVKYIQRQKEDKNVKISVRDGITEEELLKLYETFLDKIRHSIYGVRLSSQEKTLVNGKEKFIDLSVEAKCQVLYEILHLFQCQSGASNLKMIAWNDETNREGHAAKVYFNALFGLDFTRTEDNLINAALNYGYSIILSSFTREIVANGYITQLGLFHDNMFNQFNLASDLMEPFRPLVDKCVLEMKLEQFEHEEKMWLVDIQNQEVQIDGKIQYVSNAIKIYCKSVFDALNEDDSALVRFYKIEL